MLCTGPLRCSHCQKQRHWASIRQLGPRPPSTAFSPPPTGKPSDKIYGFSKSISAGSCAFSLRWQHPPMETPAWTCRLPVGVGRFAATVSQNSTTPPTILRQSHVPFSGRRTDAAAVSGLLSPFLAHLNNTCNEALFGRIVSVPDRLFYFGCRRRYIVAVLS